MTEVSSPTRKKPVFGSIKIGGKEINRTVLAPNADACQARKAQLAKTLETLPTRKSVAAQVVWMVDDPTSNTKALGNLIESDPNLTTRILRVANSAQNASFKRVTSAREATTRLGYTFIKTMAASDALGLYDDSVKPPVPAGFWIHASTTAATASTLARKVNYNTGDAFSAGLLHDLGSAMLHRCDKAEYARIVLESGEDETTMLANETKSYGVGHREAAAAILSAWNFPEELLSAIRDHHDSSDPNPEQLTSIVVAADAIAAGIEGSPLYDRRTDPIADLLFAAGIDRDDLDAVQELITIEARAIAAACEA